MTAEYTTKPAQREAYIRHLATELLRVASLWDYKITVTSHVAPNIIGPIIDLKQNASSHLL